MSNKLYAERDIMQLDEIGSHYIDHVYAMTAEKLHSKSDLAAELGHRDMLIAKLTAERDAALAQNARLLAGKWNGEEYKSLLDTATMRDIKAESGRAGFVVGYEKCWRESYGTKPNTDSVDEYADSYASRVKAGEV